MTTHTIQALYPAFYDEFSCTGPACTDNCCHTWQIEIDKAHYLRYRGEKDPTFTALCAQTVHKKKKDASEAAYARLSLDEHGRCGFQDRDGGCAIYRLLGPDALSRICTLYPRRKAEFISNSWELSLSMSCEEAVRIGVLKPSRVEFEKTELAMPEDDPLWLTQSAGIGRNGQCTEPPKYGQALRGACVRLMQCRRYTVAERILAITLMGKRIDRLILVGGESHVPIELEQFLYSVENGGFTGFFEQLDYHKEAHQTVFQVPVGHLLGGQQGTVRQALLDWLTPYLESDTSGQLCAGSRAQDALLERVKQHGDLVLEEHQVWIENYFVNYLFSSLFPFLYRQSGLSFEQHGLMLAEQYALLRIASAVLPETLNPETLLTRAFVHTARLSQHGDLGQDIKQLFQTFRVQGIAHAAYLLR